MKRSVTIAVLLVVGISAATYIVVRFTSVPTSIVDQTTGAPVTERESSTRAATLSANKKREAPEGTQEYYSEHYRFSLFYPDDLTVKTYDEGGGAATFVFQNPIRATGFQIFVTPYAEAKVSPDRFRKDVPSGVRSSERQIVVGSAVGAAFESANVALGETYEIWFIKDGYLYEATAPRSLAAWFLEIMQTWQFI